MASHIPLLEDDRLIGLDGKPLASSPVNRWPGLPFEIHPHLRQAEVAHRCNPHPLLLVHVGVHGRSRIRSGARVYDLLLAPGQVDVFAASFWMEHGWWDCTPGEVFAVDVDPQQASALLHDDAGRIEPHTLLSARDPILERLCGCIRAEVDAGCPSGRLFAEGISLSLLSRLLGHYGASSRPTTAPRVMAPPQRQRVADYIEGNLNRDLSLTRLASVLEMSPFGFAKLFRSSFETTPHEYVLTRRIRRATILLAGDLPLSEIAQRTGFASQSHFTEVFRRRTGITPARCRRRQVPATSA
jgi:AraC family transcriptional regulator